MTRPDLHVTRPSWRRRWRSNHGRAMCSLDVVADGEPSTEWCPTCALPSVEVVPFRIVDRRTNETVRSFTLEACDGCATLIRLIRPD